MTSIFKPRQSVRVEGFRVLRSPDSEVVITVFARLTDAEGEQGISIPLPVTLQLAKTLHLKLEQNL